ncbi:MAG: kinase [Magnetococcales bacterium]|nr:kinase [Magnetococcales bacterium]MBF0155804.1 kinase [Magnetococcales bacterium]
MVITRTPFRISFFGGGTDFPGHYLAHGGKVLSTTINKYCFITCRYFPPFFDYRFLIRYTEREETFHIHEIRHPSVRECLNHMGVDRGVEVTHTSDVPAMSGIGSSSSFTVGLLLALNALQGKMITKRQLLYDALHVEQELIGENVGSQDQTAAAFGGLNRIDFVAGSGEIQVLPVPLSQERRDLLQQNLLLYFTGFQRFSSDIAAEQVERIEENRRQLEATSGYVDRALEILNGPVAQLDDFGRLLDEAWQVKRGLTSRVSNAQLDEFYAAAKAAGALGGKVCGAGGGGFMLFYVPLSHQARFKSKLHKLLMVPFRFDMLGSQIIYYAPMS